MLLIQVGTPAAGRIHSCRAKYPPIIIAGNIKPRSTPPLFSLGSDIAGGTSPPRFYSIRIHPGLTGA